MYISQAWYQDRRTFWTSLVLVISKPYISVSITSLYCVSQLCDNYYHWLTMLTNLSIMKKIKYFTFCAAKFLLIINVIIEFKSVFRQY